MELIKLGKVIKSYIAKVSGSGALAQWLAVEEFAGDERKAQVFGGCNEDFAPPNDMSTIDVPLGRDRGFLTSVAYRNQKITPVAIAGERRLYSTNEAGDTVMAEVFMKQDGTILVKNAIASMTMAPNGDITTENAIASINMTALGAIEVKNAIGSIDISALGQIDIVNANSNINMTPAGAITINGVTIEITGILTNNAVNVGSTHVHVVPSAGTFPKDTEVPH